MQIEEAIICSGPVIIENSKVLLIKEQKSYGITPWFFPGGKIEGNETSEEACIRETREEVGLNIKILKQLPTLTDYDNKGNKLILFHFLAKANGQITPGPTIAQWNWFDIKHLPTDCAQNVKKIIKYCLNEKI
jgi:8-oxo-dGTP diphosphatase